MKTRTKIIFCFLFLLVQAGSMRAQQKEIVVAGWVRDTTLAPLAGATVSELGSQHTVVTDAKGFFRLKTRAAKIRIRVRYQSYETFEQEFSQADLREDTLWLRVKLRPSVSVLETVDINVQDIELVHKKPTILVLDYDFYNDDLILLVKEAKHYQLIQVDEQDSVLRRIGLAFQPIELFKDCMGNFHVRTSDSVYQLFEIDRQWVLDKGFSAWDFDRMVTPCKAASEKYLYFCRYGLHNQSLLYYQLEKTNGIGKNIRLVNDAANTKGVEDYAQRAYAGLTAYGGSLSWENLRAQRDAQDDVWFYERILSREVYHPLFRLNDSIFIFDHFADSVFIYDLDGRLLRMHTIGYEQARGWDKEMMEDVGTGIFYARCSRDGLSYLLELSPGNFSVVKEHRLDRHIFPEKIKVRNGYAYYLYNTKTGFAVMNLYRQRLK